ncbi:unnamed protein product [Calicophoron daubneyi]|uniref:CARMIL C-terminal domain-containing protein n=1 Tax=Calicophoron daubneyi TaxID=300641 RepID=A0AAV2TPF1_CALDB
MVGIDKAEECDSPPIDPPKSKRKGIFSRLGERISRAFHRHHHSALPKRIKNGKHSHSTGDILKDVAEDKYVQKSVNDLSKHGTVSRQATLDVDDRAISIGHIHGACGNSPRSSDADCSPGFLTSAFRNELNSKLRIRPGLDSTGRTTNKSAGSSGSLVSNDSLLCTPKSTTTPILSGDGLRTTSMTGATGGATPQPDSTPTSPTSSLSNALCLQHRLNVSRQRNRRPPTKANMDKMHDPLDSPESPKETDLGSFFSSPSATSHLGLITEEESEPHGTQKEQSDNRQKKTHEPSTPVQPSCPPAVAEPTPLSCPGKPAKPPVPKPRSRVAQIARQKRNSAGDDTSSSVNCTPIKPPRPVSMFISSSADDSTHKHHMLISFHMPNESPCQRANGHAPSEEVSPTANMQQSQSQSVTSEFPPENDASEKSSPEEPNLGSVADRASLFGNIRNVSKTERDVLSSLQSPQQDILSNPACARLKADIPNEKRSSRVFDLVKNFESAH